MQGYFENPDATAAVTRDGGWIDTGDLGFLDDEGDLFVTGRAKDVIIAGGRNIYPQEVEEAVADVPGIRRGCVAAFGVQDAQERHRASGRRRRDARRCRRTARRCTPPSPRRSSPPSACPPTPSSSRDRAASPRRRRARSAGPRRASSTRAAACTAAAPPPPGSGCACSARHVAWRAGRGAAFAGTLLYSAWVWTAVGIVGAAAVDRRRADADAAPGAPRHRRGVPPAAARRRLPAARRGPRPCDAAVAGGDRRQPRQLPRRAAAARGAAADRPLRRQGPAHPLSDPRHDPPSRRLRARAARHARVGGDAGGDGRRGRFALHLSGRARSCARRA